MAKDAAFFKDWSDNVEIFCSLARFRPKKDRIGLKKQNELLPYDQIEGVGVEETLKAILEVQE